MNRLIIILTIILFHFSSLSFSSAPHGIAIDKQTYPITGIDVSEYCGKIDFQKVKKQNIDFVFIRASLGANTADAKFDVNYKNAKKAETPVGAYHFFKFKSDGISQAKNFLKQIKGKDFDLPLVIDVEEWGNKGKFNKNVIVRNIRKFIQIVRKERNEDLIFYSNRHTYDKYIRYNFQDEKVWICSFKTPSQLSYEWLFWQHSHKGRLNGVDGLVDINTFNGSKREWESYLKSLRLNNSED